MSETFSRQTSQMSNYSIRVRRQSTLATQSSVTSVEERTAGEKYLIQGFKYLYLATQLCGLVFIKPKDAKWTARCICSVVYYAVLLAFTWANVVRYCWAYDPGETFSPELMTKVSIHVLYFFTAFTYTACITMSLRRSHIVHLWSSYYMKHNISPKLPAHRLQRRTIVVLVISFIIWLCSISAQLLEPLTNSPFGILSMLPFVKGYKHRSEVPAMYTVAQTLINTLVCAAHCLYMAWIIIIGLALKDEYKLLTKDCVETEELNELDIEAVRMRHLDLSTLVQEVDNMVSFYILILFISNVPCGCIEIYLLLLWDLSFEYKFIILSSLCISLFMLLTVILIGTWLNEKACSIKQELYCLSLNEHGNWPQLKMMQYLTFLHYVGEGDIGFTAWRIFYIRKHTLQMVVLLLISYTVILVKFGTVLNPNRGVVAALEDTPINNITLANASSVMDN